MREEQPRTQGRRKADHSIWRKVWFRWTAAAMTVSGGALAQREYRLLDVVPGGTWRTQVDKERETLIPQFYEMQKDVERIKSDIEHNRELSQAQRVEILRRIDDLETKLERWFVRAGRER